MLGVKEHRLVRKVGALRSGHSGSRCFIVYKRKKCKWVDEYFVYDLGKVDKLGLQIHTWFRYMRITLSNVSLRVDLRQGLPLNRTPNDNTTLAT